MPVRISHLSADQRTIKIPWGDDAVIVTYRPSGISPAIEDRVREHMAAEKAGAMLVELLASCLVDWDLLDDNGRPLPTNKKALRELPTVFLTKVTTAITEDMSPNLMSGGTSAAGCKQKVG